MKPLQKIAFIRFSSIGDIVLTSAAVRATRKRYPHAAIHFVTKKAFKDLVQPNPNIDKVHFLEDRLWDLISELRKEQFDVIIDLHHNLRSLVVKIFLMVKSYSFPKLNVLKWLYVRTKRNVMPDIHIVDRTFVPLKSIDVYNDGQGLDFFVPEASMVSIFHTFGVSPNSYIALMIGAKFNTKKIPLSKLKMICEQSFGPIILIGGREDIAAKEELMSLLDHKEWIFDAVGQFSILQTASIIKQAKLVITADTGMMHIAAAFDKRIISLWGNTTKELGMYPYHVTEQKILEVSLPCRPCSKIGFDQCPKGHFNCMMSIKDSDIKDSIAHYMNLM